MTALWPVHRLACLSRASFRRASADFISSHGGRPVLAIGALLLAGGLAALGAANSFPIYLAAWAVIGAGMGAEPL